VLAALFWAAVSARKTLDKIDPHGLSNWEKELCFQLLISDVNSIRLSPYRKLITGHEEDPTNELLRRMVNELKKDAKECPEGLEKILSPKAFEMLINEAARLENVSIHKQ